MAGGVNKSQHKKQNMELLIDGENISYAKAKKIMRAARSQGILYEGKVYGRQCDSCTKKWSGMSKVIGVSDIRLYGEPEKNKVDNKIKKDARRLVDHSKNVDIVCLVTNDGGYTDVIFELRSKGKRVVVIGTSDAATSLREACNEFIEV